MKTATMARRLFPFLAAMIVLLQSCKKDPAISGDSRYTVQFNLTASGQTVVIDRTVINSPTRYYFDILRFYAGYIRLVKTNGTEVPLTDLAIVSFDNNLPFNNIYGQTFTFTAPSGSYRALRFGIGLPAKIKDTIQHYHNGNGLTNDPLDGYYGLNWGMNSKVYRNMVMEMYIDTSAAQNQAPKKYFRLHVLENDTTVNLYREVEIADAFSAAIGLNHILNLNIDANTIFFNPAAPVDLRHAGSTDMQASDKAGFNLGIQIDDNLAKAISKQ